MAREDGGPLDPPERGDWESAVERARAAVTECPDCAGRAGVPPDGDGSFCLGKTWAKCEDCRKLAPQFCALHWPPCGWAATSEDIVEAWADAHLPDSPEEDDGA